MGSAPYKKYINDKFSPSFKLREDQIFLLQRFRPRSVDSQKFGFGRPLSSQKLGRDRLITKTKTKTEKTYSVVKSELVQVSIGRQSVTINYTH